MDNKNALADKDKKVAKGKVTGRKSSGKSGFGSIKQAFFAGDMKDVENTVVYDVLVPMMKDAISSMFHTAVDVLIYGEKKNSSSRYNTYSGGTNYNRISNDNIKNKYSSYNTVNANSRSAYNYMSNSPNVAVGTRWEAEEVLDQINSIMQDYHSATVRDLLVAVDVEPDVMDNKYGWYEDDFADFSIRRRLTDGMYEIVTPRPRILR